MCEFLDPLGKFKKLVNDAHEPCASSPEPYNYAKKGWVAEFLANFQKQLEQEKQPAIVLFTFMMHDSFDLVEQNVTIFVHSRVDEDGDVVPDKFQVEVPYYGKYDINHETVILSSEEMPDFLNEIENCLTKHRTP